MLADGVSGCGIATDTCRHFPHQLVSLKASQTLQSHQPWCRAICLALPVLSPPSDKYLESSKPAGARRSPVLTAGMSSGVLHAWCLHLLSLATHVIVRPEGREVDEPHLPTPQPSCRLEAQGREVGSCHMAPLSLTKVGSTSWQTAFADYNHAPSLGTSGVCKTLSAHLKESWRHSADGYHLKRPPVHLRLVRVQR